MQTIEQLRAALAQVVCPVCFGTLRLEPVSVHCTSCSRRYPLEDGIPVLLAARAQEANTEPD
ncbi:Trm112 family protein [Silvibacterium sp.]|uniref:Trm112 family protein n=1 Tax=Silvibacterium sp. TaxID=1964179 RepID=UPI0039E3BD93